jgi:hypothetical protein
MSGNNFASLSPAVQAMTRIQQLNMSHNEFNAEGAASLSTALHTMSGIQQLDLSDRAATAEPL